MADKDGDDIDWGGMLLFASAMGNLVQAGMGLKTGEQNKKLLEDRERIARELQQFRNAAFQFKAKIHEMEQINLELSRKVDERDEKIEELNKNWKEDVSKRDQRIEELNKNWREDVSKRDQRIEDLEIKLLSKTEELAQEKDKFQSLNQELEKLRDQKEKDHEDD